MKKLAWMLALAMPFAIASCGDDDPAEITLDQNSISLNYGASQTLKASEKNCTWGSSDEFVATVDKDGKIEAKHVGEAVITVTKDGASAQCKVVVKPTNTKFTLPILSWGASKATVESEVAKIFNDALSIVVDNKDALAYATKADADGFPMYTYSFSNDALDGASFTVSTTMDEQGDLQGFLEQYYEQDGTTEDATLIYYDGKNAIDASVEVEYGMDDDEDIFVSFIPVKHTTKAGTGATRETLKEIARQAKK